MESQKKGTGQGNGERVWTLGKRVGEGRRDRCVKEGMQDDGEIRMQAKGVVVVCV